MSKPKLNNVKNRFLQISEAVAKGYEPEPKISDFEIIKELGTGSFGKVLLVVHKVTKVQYAIKVIDKRNKANIEEKPYFRREIEIMYKIQHPNVVRLYSNFEDDNNCYFIMECINKGNLYNLLPKDKTRKKLSQQLVAGIMKDVISAVYFLHNMDPPTIHRDIKPENVLLDEKGTAKLTDFGWSNYIEPEEKRTTYCGTPIYLAPEIILQKGHDWHVDIWCIGVLLFELITSTIPFEGTDIKTLEENITHLRIVWPKDINMDAKNLIGKILKLDPKSRISLEDILNHPFFTKNISNPSQYLIKPTNLPNSLFIVSKDDPNNMKPRPEEPKTPIKVIEETKGVLNTEPSKPIIKAKERDQSPLPKSRLHLEDKMDQIIKLENANEIESSDLSPGKANASDTKYMDQLQKDYEKLQTKYNAAINLDCKTDDELTKIKEKIKYIETHPTSDPNSDNSSKKEEEEMLQSLEHIASNLSKENNILKSRIYELESCLGKKKSGFDTRLDVIRDSLRALPGDDQIKKSANSFLAEVDKLKNELQAEKDKFNLVLQEKNAEMKKLYEEQNEIKNNEEMKHVRQINKYESLLSAAEKDNKILKVKIKELESQLTKMTLDK